MSVVRDLESFASDRGCLDLYKFFLNVSSIPKGQDMGLHILVLCISETEASSQLLVKYKIYFTYLLTTC